jgi:hypothetical protein
MPNGIGAVPNNTNTNAKEPTMAVDTAAALYRYPTIRWSAVFGGWLVATGIAFLMYALGLAVGFSAIDATDAEASAKGLGIGTALWLILTWAVSLFLGGMFASWLDGTTDKSVGSLHGVCVWALATTVSVVLVALGFTNLLQGGASLLKGGATAGATAVAAGGAAAKGGGMLDGPTAGLQADLKQQIAQAMTRASQPAPAARPQSGGTAGASAPADQGGGQVNSAEMRKAMESIDAQTTASVAGELMRGNMDAAKSRLAAGTTLSRAEVDQVVQGMNQQVERAKAKAKEAADKAASYTSAAMWAMFISSIIALIAAALGGWMGGANMHRVWDTEIVR